MFPAFRVRIVILSMSKKNKKLKDPHAERESRRYQHPIPSREAITDLLRQEGKLLRFGRLSRLLGLDNERDLVALERRLGAMVRDGQLALNRRGAYGIAEKMDLRAGRVQANAEGFGFFIPDDEGEDIFLSPKQMRLVMHGDRVLVSVTGVDRRGRTQGTIAEVLERAHTHLVGRFFEESGIDFVVPDMKRMNHDVLIPGDRTGGAEHGDYVYIQILEQPTRHRQPVGEVLDVLGRNIDAPLAVELAIRSFGLPDQFPAPVLEEAEAAPDHVSEAETEGRRDLRELPLITIDGEDARDFDDAVLCEPRAGGGWRLHVAIADVSHYVRPGSALDDEAVQRGTSAYFPNRVVPMLPEALSNGICSLNPDVDRLCMVCEMSLDERGKVKRSKFYTAVMRSHARLTYNQVWRILSDPGCRERDQYQRLLPAIESLYDMYQAMRSLRERRGALDFESQEVYFRFADDGDVAEIVPYERNDAHKIIEECMIAANVEAARFLDRNDLPGMYRVHSPPQLKRYEELTGYLAELGLRLPRYERLEPQHIAQLLEKVKERPDGQMVQAMLLRAQSLAAYESGNDGHFGLALKAYAHFTSPIRRYPDLVVHRAIRKAIDKSKGARRAETDMAELAAHCSMTERRAEEASRDVDERLKCRYLASHVGESFEGVVTGVTSFGLFVELAETRISGLVHVTSLPNDYYHFDSASHSLTGERSRRRYRLSDPLQVQVLHVDIEDRKIDLGLVEA